MMHPSLLELLIAAGVKPPMACCLEYAIKEAINDGVKEAELRIQQNLKREIEREVRRAEIRINLQRAPATDVSETNNSHSSAPINNEILYGILGEYFRNRKANFWYPFASGKEAGVWVASLIGLYCFGFGLGVWLAKIIELLFFQR